MVYRENFEIQQGFEPGRTVTHSQTSLGIKARDRLGFRAGYDVL